MELQGQKLTEAKRLPPPDAGREYRWDLGNRAAKELRSQGGGTEKGGAPGPSEPQVQGNGPRLTHLAVSSPVPTCRQDVPSSQGTGSNDSDRESA